jgi:16S rRNA (guanine966-N2)-methyltransferase
MRIIGGAYRGRPLYTPTGQDIRPTSDKVRLAIFNALNSRGAVVDSVVLDAFCGTGALGLEALSQGAAVCTFLDSARESLDLARQNAKSLGVAADRAIFFPKNSMRAGPKPENIQAADLVFLDPPYGKGFVPLSLVSLIQGGWIAPGAILVLETEREAGLSSCPIEILSEKFYGKTKTTLARLAGNGE